MNAHVELNLALILFLPWFVILAVLFWVYPRAPRNRTRRLFDASSLAIAVGAATLGTYWSFHNADPGAGSMWQQVLASTVSYGLFLLVMTSAIFVRKRFVIAPYHATLAQPRAASPSQDACA